jgi:hypothetical protein
LTFLAVSLKKGLSYEMRWPPRGMCEGIEMFCRFARISASGVLAATLLSGPACGSDSQPDGGAEPPTPIAPSPQPQPQPQPSPQPGRGAILSKLDCTPGNFPSCGWSEAGNGQGNYTSRLLDGQGPKGTDAVEFTQMAGPSRQYYMGWATPTSGEEPAGVTRYMRVRVWVPGPAGQINGYHGGWDAKFMILGDGGNAAGRVICNMRDNGRSSDTMSIECQRNIDGGDHSTGLLPLTLGTWHDVQVEARSGPAASIAVWVDNNDYARPTARTTGRFQLETTNWKFLGVGFYAGVPRSQSRDLVVLRIADDIEFGTGFDPTWH